MIEEQQRPRGVALETTSPVLDWVALSMLPGAFVNGEERTPVCLDVFGASHAAGALVGQWTCNGGDNQRWQLVAAGGGYYNIIVKHSGQCLDVSGISQADGASVVQWPCNGGTNQQWQLVPTDSGYAKLIARHSGKCLDVYGVSQTPGANVVQWTCNGGSNQQWLVAAG